MKPSRLLPVLALAAVVVIALRLAPSPPAAAPPLAPAGTGETTPVPTDHAADLVAGLEFPTEPRLRPLPVARTSDRHEWTAGDGFAPDILHRIAHNPAEFRRLIEENDRILGRQLVYRKETVVARFQLARARGETVREITLPALDGQELVVELTGADLAPSAQRGTLHGRLRDRPQSLVTLAFKGGREAFTVMSPEDGVYLQADPREPGEIIVKRFDPATYIVGACGTES